MSLVLALALVAFGLFTGLASGVLGVGGGIFMVPFLVFAAHLGQHGAQATSLAVVLPTAIVASVTLRSKGVGDLRTSLTIGTLGAVGAAAGALLALALPGATLRVVFAVFLGLIGLRLFIDAARMPRRATPAGPAADITRPR